MTEDQQKAVDSLVDTIESFWAPVIEEVTRRTGWPAEQVWNYQVMGSVQAMERRINRLLAGYEKAAQSQEKMRPKTDKLMDLSLKALESESDDHWKDDKGGE